MLCSRLDRGESAVMWASFFYGIKGPLIMLALFVAGVLLLKYLKYQWDKAGGV